MRNDDYGDLAWKTSEVIVGSDITITLNIKNRDLVSDAETLKAHAEAGYWPFFHGKWQRRQHHSQSHSPAISAFRLHSPPRPVLSWPWGSRSAVRLTHEDFKLDCGSSSKQMLWFWSSLVCACCMADMQQRRL
eukprot:jgi/Botrbrau1/23048/Bobra.136_1s0036.1